jgi:hypothetical protein
MKVTGFEVLKDLTSMMVTSTRNRLIVKMVIPNILLCWRVIFLNEIDYVFLKIF